MAPILLYDFSKCGVDLTKICEDNMKIKTRRVVEHYMKTVSYKRWCVLEIFKVKIQSPKARKNSFVFCAKECIIDSYSWTIHFLINPKICMD